MTKLTICQEIAVLMAAENVKGDSTAKHILDKIQSIERAFKVTHDWANNTGQGVDDVESFADAMKKRCYFYYELEPIMGDRAASRPTATNLDSILTIVARTIVARTKTQRTRKMTRLPKLALMMRMQNTKLQQQWRVSSPFSHMVVFSNPFANPFANVMCVVLFSSRTRIKRTLQMAQKEQLCAFVYCESEHKEEPRNFFFGQEESEMQACCSRNRHIGDVHALRGQLL
jgi:hypothetical protein